MKVSEITIKDLMGYIKLDDDIADEEYTLLEAALIAAKNYVMGVTGLNEVELDSKEDLTIAIFCLVADMYDNRSLDSSGKTNKTVETILKLHDRNFL